MRGLLGTDPPDLTLECASPPSSGVDLTLIQHRYPALTPFRCQMDLTPHKSMQKARSRDVDLVLGCTFFFLSFKNTDKKRQKKVQKPRTRPFFIAPSRVASKTKHKLKIAWEQGGLARTRSSDGFSEGFSEVFCGACS